MNKNLDNFYGFFVDKKILRLCGLSKEHFSGFSVNDREEAWNFLVNRFSVSAERIEGMASLDKERAIGYFKKALEVPLEKSEYAAERKELEVARLLMLKHVNNFDPDERYLLALAEFAASEFEEVRAEFAYSLPVEKNTPESIDALRAMILTEVSRIPHAAAVEKIMAIHGLASDSNPSYKSIYKLLRLGSYVEKLSAMDILAHMQQPDLI